MMLNIPREELANLYIKEQRTTREIAEVYNTDKKVICDYLHRYKIEVRPDSFPNTSVLICKNGQRVRSHYERAFLNEMLTQEIDFLYEPRIPNNRRYSADFKVGNIYVEVWGMVGWESYEKRMEVKKEIYKNNNLKLFNVYPSDFKNVRGKVNELKNLID